MSKPFIVNIMESSKTLSLSCRFDSHYSQMHITFNQKLKTVLSIEKDCSNFSEVMTNLKNIRDFYGCIAQDDHVVLNFSDKNILIEDKLENLYANKGKIIKSVFESNKNIKCIKVQVTYYETFPSVKKVIYDKISDKQREDSFLLSVTPETVETKLGSILKWIESIYSKELDLVIKLEEEEKKDLIDETKISVSVDSDLYPYDTLKEMFLKNLENGKFYRITYLYNSTENYKFSLNWKSINM